ncbi:hypothetical protein DYY67_1135 [Candidatus Nitrosotalea sp. TS]|nr:hypothetical protein [Candidatus Nitrosotalea sp. TS]
MIIVVEGFDQAGKKTQSKLLAKFLKTRNIKSKIFSFPDYSTPIGKEIRRYLGGKRSFSPTSNPLSSCSKQVGEGKGNPRCIIRK